MNLENIKDPSFLKKLNISELEELATDIRSFLVSSISKTGGHLASNLGIVELTIALHYVFDSPKDKFIFDVGHQMYTHKILTGRAKDFNTLRSINGLSGFSSNEESAHDQFTTGHSSTSISALSGLLISNPDNYNVAIIGDGALTGGEAFEGLNYLGSLKQNAIIVLNDNNMTISESVGALHENSDIKSFFEILGFSYLGPINGNDIHDCIEALKMAKLSNKPIVVHAKTLKGKGYKFAEDNPSKFHGISPFDVNNGIEINKKTIPSWSRIICECLIKLKEKYDLNIIVPAMINGMELKPFRDLYPDSIIDVGIAEQHAITMATGASLGNKKIFVPMYSTFLQRAYDQIISDAARMHANLVIGIDRAGLVGEDGDTHQGIFDLAMLNTIPGLTILCPSNPSEAFALLDYAFNYDGVVAIRYPKDYYDCSLKDINKLSIDTKWVKEKIGSKLTIISYGRMLNNILKITNDLDVTIVNARFIKPIDYDLLDEIIKENKKIMVIEEVTNTGCLAESIAYYATINHKSIDLEAINLKDSFIKHGSVSDLLKQNGLDNDSLLRRIYKCV